MLPPNQLAQCLVQGRPASCPLLLPFLSPLWELPVLSLPLITSTFLIKDLQLGGGGDSQLHPLSQAFPGMT